MIFEIISHSKIDFPKKIQLEVWRVVEWLIQHLTGCKRFDAQSNASSIFRLKIWRFAFSWIQTLKFCEKKSIESDFFFWIFPNIFSSGVVLVANENDNGM